jgi:hypothetical protein
MRRLAKPVVFVLALVPLAGLIFIVLTGRTSANPAEDIQLTTGIWAFPISAGDPGDHANPPIDRVERADSIPPDARPVCVFSTRPSTFSATSRSTAPLHSARSSRHRQASVHHRRDGCVPVHAAAGGDLDQGVDSEAGPPVADPASLIYVSALAACLHFIWKVKVVIGEPSTTRDPGRAPGISPALALPSERRISAPNCTRGNALPPFLQDA